MLLTRVPHTQQSIQNKLKLSCAPKQNKKKNNPRKLSYPGWPKKKKPIKELKKNLGCGSDFCG